MADPSPSPTQPPATDSNPQTSEPQNPNPDSQPNSTPPPPAPPAINPNPNPNPNQPQINPYASVPPPAPPSFRPQFTPIPNLPAGYPSQQTHGVPPPGVTSAPPPQQPVYQPQQQQQQPMYPGQPQQLYPGQQPQQLVYPGQQYPGQPQQQQPVYPGQPQPNPGLRPPFMPMPNGYPGVVRYPYPPMARPPFLPRPGVAGGTVPPLPRPPFMGVRPPVTLPIVRPPVLPVVTPAEKPQTTVYVGKIASSVENDFIRSLLELCGPIKSWKRAQDPSDGTPRRFGFCEFESAEGVLRALRLLSKCNVDGEELVLNVNQATREFLERYVAKKKEDLNKQGEAGTEEAKKEGENVPDIEKGGGDEENEPAKAVVEESKNEVNETEKKESDTASFGLVTDEDRVADKEALEKLTNMIEERIKNKPLPPPPPPPAQKIAEGGTNSNSEVPAKSGDKDSETDIVKNDEKNDDEMSSDPKSASRAGTESPDRSRRHDNRGRDRDRERDRRDKERELDRLERERERERVRRERERELEIHKAERFYKERVKEWETREKDREYKRKYEREKEKERERERRSLIMDQEDESDDDSRKRRRKSEIEEKRRRRRREKEEDLADRLKEEEEIAEAKKRAEEEQQKEQEKQMMKSPSVPVANGGDKPMLTEAGSRENKDDMVVEAAHDSDPAPASNAHKSSSCGDGVLENGNTDEPMVTSDSTSDVKPSPNVPAKKLGFGLQGSGKRTTVPSVFHEEEDDDAQNDKKMRPLVPIDYSTEERQVIHTNDGQPPNSSAAAESGKRVSSKEVKSETEKERSRRSHDRSSHRDRDRDRDRDREADDASRAPRILDAKQLIDMIPKTKDDLFSYEINWAVYDENRLHERMRPWISKKITEFLGEEETTLVEFIVDRFREHAKAEKMLEVLQQILDDEAEMFVLKMWRMLIFEIKRVETGLTSRPGA